MNATFILIIIKVPVDIIIVLKSVLDVTAVAVATAVWITTDHHQAALNVGVIQLTGFAMNEPRKRVVVTLYARQSRTERRPIVIQLYVKCNGDYEK